ncbi:MAG: hypothetical protein ABSE18_01395 [Minisyncoccia bacterium]|jgi:cyanophycin synthetase
MAYCEHCFPFPPRHFENWFNDLLELLFYPPFERITPSFFNSQFFEKAITDCFVLTGIVRKEKEFLLNEINPIAALFIQRGRARGIEFEALRGPFGYLTFFRMRIGGRSYEFDRLPGASANSLAADDKWHTKKALRTLGYPVATGRSFWWFQKRKAARYAATLEYPVVVKPRKGSLSQHLFIVKSASELLPALRGVNAYSPVFMVEKFVPDATLYRITIVDGKEMFVVKRLPAEVMGDGKSTLRALIRKIKFNQKNLDKTVLEEQGVGLDSLIAKGKKIFLQRKAILALGSKIEKVPIAEVHRDIVAMGRAIAKHFRLPLVGIDILLRDHARPLKGQTAAILELNTLPNILIHTFRKNGEAENEVADALVDFALARFGGGRSADGARGGQTNQR